MQSKIQSEGRKTKWPKILAGGVVLLVVLISVSLVLFNFKVKAPNSKVDQEVDFEIEKGQGVREIAANLEKEELLSYPTVFLIYLRHNGLTADLKAGAYTLNKNMNIINLSDVLTGGKVKNSKVIIVEGLRVEEIAKKLNAEGLAGESEFLEAIEGDYEYDFLKDKPKDQNLEGYLFPDTYFLSAEVSTEQIIKKMLDNFSNKFTEKLERSAAEQGYNIHEIITLASIVEKEVSNREDMELVAGVLKNRLDIGMALQSDVTNHYLVGDWKKELTWADLNINSPYNTRKFKGLPPGPICSPGIASIEATINHKESDYLYYLSDKDGNTHYSYTMEEHDQKKAKYLE